VCVCVCVCIHMLYLYYYYITIILLESKKKVEKKVGAVNFLFHELKFAELMGGFSPKLI
jgi:hypothetical protein